MPRLGFSLIELLVVLVIVSIAMGMMLPRFRITAYTAVQLMGMQMAQDIDVARTRALTTRLPVRVRFHTSTGTYGGYLDHDGDGVFAESAVEWQALRGFGERRLDQGVRFGRGNAPPLPDNSAGGDITFAEARVDFDARGLVRPMGTGGVVYLVKAGTPDAVVAVAVTPSGNTRLWTWRTEEGWR
jgi:prepilin-type N-terminal cleavage/methylation domain-containing protein